ncbi:MAG TPA: RNA polymerase sigma-I factor [Desulfobacteria bacterium]|nr:RNA polymerase sigma-I factor [Desulfobacteria bacterium]
MSEWRCSWVDLQADPQTREAFLKESQPFVRHVACRICGRVLEWGKDEELSEGLLAFNEAIDRFEQDRGVPFLAYARLLIKRRLIDYFRREKLLETPLDNDDLGRTVDLKFSVEEYKQTEQNNERASEIKEFAQELNCFGLNFNDLVQASPKHRDTREKLLNAAYELATDPLLWSQVEQKGRVPIQALAHKTKLHLKVLERGRKFLLASALLIAHRYNYVYLREYVLPPERRESQ